MNLTVHPKRFNAVYVPHINNNRPLQLYFGGGGSGKSVFIAQRIALDMWRGERNFLVARKVAATLYDSVYTEIKKAIYNFGKEFSDQFEFLKSPLRITHKYTRSCCVFIGLDDVEKVKSITPERGVFTDAWIEEATECNESDVDQITIRLRGRSKVVKRVTLSFNPVLNTHWIAQRYCATFGDDEKEYLSDSISLIRTTYLDNRFLEPDDIAKIERYKEINPRFYRVYGLGLWGTLGDVIFENVTVEDLSQMKFDTVYNGVDFGFANDPTAFIQCAVRGDDVYIIREHVRGAMTNRDIYDVVFPIVGRNPVTCDCSEPKSIDELNRLGLCAYATSKGADSVMHGIQWLLNKRIHIDTQCKETAHEFAVYQWDKDRDGRAINRPVDSDNHCIDAIRYALNKVIINKGPAFKSFNANFI